jgi:hypothetical protein
MRKLIQNILHILDGTPAVYGKRSSGQSLVELALITPILIVLIMGLVEVGYFANNYLILLETSRVGARRGTTLSGNLGPMEWNYAASVHYNIQQPPVGETAPYNYRNCGVVGAYPGFYNFLTCIMEQSMAPLTLNFCDPPDLNVCKDDIVISLFAVQAIDRNVVTLTSPPPNATPGVNMVVVGRWPHNANECSYNAAGGVAAQEPRDPFDFSTNQDDDELDDHAWYDTTPEKQRGFVYLAQHRLWDNPNCFGSEWTVAEVEQLMNLPNFTLSGTQRQQLPSQGLVLVEIFWEHDLLLENPVFNPVFRVLGDRTIISVWAAFPVPAAEPRIRFDANNIEE